MEVLIPEKLIIYDGHCVICNTSVHYVYKYDKTKSVHFANSDSRVVDHLKNASNIEFNPNLSIIFYSKGQLFYKSDAIIEISKHLRPPFGLLKYFRFVPRKWRDWVYNLIASNRYRIFKHREACIIPDKELQKRIIE